MKTKWSMGVASVLLACLMLIAGCGAPKEQENPPEAAASPEVEQYKEEADAKPKQGGRLKLGIYSVDSLNPLLTKSKADADVLSIMYDGLFKVDSNLGVSKRLCQSYNVSADGKQYTFYLRSDVLFHDGSKLSASDVNYSFRLASLSPVYGTGLSNMAACQVSGGAVRVTLKTPDANFPAACDFPVVKYSNYMPSTAQNDQKKAKSTATPMPTETYEPNGTGMYKLQSYQEKRELTLVMNEQWGLDTRPYISEVVIKILPNRDTMINAFENMEIDAISSDVINLSEYAPKRNLKVKDYLTQKLTFAGVNSNRTFFNTPMTRKAISLLTDRDKIVQSAFSGRATATDLPINSGSFLYTMPENNIIYDYNKAKTYLMADGWEDSDQDGILDRMVDKKRVTFQLEILVNQDNNSRVKTAELMSESLKQAGISASVKSVPFNTYSSLINSGSYDLFLGEMNLSQTQNLRALLEGGQVKYSDEKLSERFGVIDGSGGGDGLVSAQKEMNDYLRENNPVIGICFASGALMFDERLKGDIAPAYTNVFADMERWYIAE